MENTTKQRMQELVDRLNTYARAYYVEDAPLISDGEYDALEAELIALEKETGIVLPDSPTHRVGGEPLEKFEEHRHLGRLWTSTPASGWRPPGPGCSRAPAQRAGRSGRP